MNSKIYIFDTTLRDGEQSPGATMTSDEKIIIADALDNMGVDVIEAGFAASSPGDFDCITKISERSKNAIICSLARTKESDIESAGKAVKSAKRGRIHIFISTSPVHIKYKLKKEPHEVLEMTESSVKYARKFTDDVEWSAEDATRSESDFLCKCVECAIKNGATTINLPDTVGYTSPNEYFEFIKGIITRVPNSDKVIFSTHCHNDLGMATSNSLAAILAGARQIECTINGIGERAGNAALEEVVMAIKTRNDLYPFNTNINTRDLTSVSRLVSNITGFQVQRNKAIVGANAFSHASGIHQDGMLKNRDTYEIIKPEDIGLDNSKLVLGKLSGRAALKDRLKNLNINLEDNEIGIVFEKFKKLCDYKKDITDDDIIALTDYKINSFDDDNDLKLDSYGIVGGFEGNKKVDITLKKGNEKFNATMESKGSINALFEAINKVVDKKLILEQYDVRSLTSGIDSIAEVKVLLNYEGKIFGGSGRDIDTIAASIKAYLNAINKINNYRG
jgi:2-isopropylmalate synthase